MATTPHSEPLLMDINAAAAFVGVGSGVIRGWASDGLAFVRAGRGGKKMFARRDIERYVERRKESAGA
ncbi:MAG: helix-turn-helix domain-containing protein [Acidobacteriia bacterium]|nr:helix-turn-helix domain-containing protein [Terriglobia bacterium]